MNSLLTIKIFSSSTFNIAINHVSSTWQWYVIRAAGFVAVGLLILVVLFGIGMVTGFIFRFIEPTKAWIIHRTLALALVLSLIVHIGFLFFDHFISFNIFQVLLPFSSHYKEMKLFGINLGSFGVATGIIGMYLLIIIILSSLGWIETKKGIWRRLHYLGYLAVVFIFFHVLYTGSDVSYGFFRMVWILVGILLILAVLVRLYRAGTIRHKD